MKYLNLSEGFNPYNAKPQELLNFEAFFFSGGEPHFRINDFLTPEQKVTITTRVNSWNDLGMLAEAVSALNYRGINDIKLFMPYVLGARQDRVCNIGEGFTLKVVADFINNLQFTSVTILDPHSDVTPALIYSVQVMNNHDFVRDCLFKLNLDPENSYIVSPDAGSNKKITGLMKSLPNTSKKYTSEILKCDKTRDLKTGKLTGFEVYKDDIKGKDCVIVDDICDGGGTFIGLAKELKLKGAGKIYLIVTHGIFSKFFRPFVEDFTGIYTTDSITSDYGAMDLRYDSCSKLLKQIPIKL